LFEYVFPSENDIFTEKKIWMNVFAHIQMWCGWLHRQTVGLTWKGRKRFC